MIPVSRLAIAISGSENYNAIMVEQILFSRSIFLMLSKKRDDEKSKGAVVVKSSKSVDFFGFFLGSYKYILRPNLRKKAVSQCTLDIPFNNQPVINNQ